MSGARYRPRRRWRHELIALALVLALPVCVALVFPFDAVGFVPHPDRPEPEARCAFVRLDAEGLARARAAVRTSWQPEAREVRTLPDDFLADALPEEEPGEVMDLSHRVPLKPAGPVAYAGVPLPPSRAAAPAVRLEPLANEAGAAFPRSELLKIE